MDRFLEKWKFSVNKHTIMLDGHFSSLRIDENSIEIIQLSRKGGLAYNLDVSKPIVRNVGNYFVKQGLPAEKIIGKGYGK